MFDIDINLPLNLPLATGNVADVGAKIGVEAVQALDKTLDKLSDKWRGPTYVALGCLAAWVAFKGFVAVHQELYGTVPVKNDVTHHDEVRRPGPQ